jgi:transposase-like protein
MIALQSLLDDRKCYETVRRLRWPEGVRCPHCGGGELSKQGFDVTQKARQKYRCKGCGRHFDDLTGTVFARAAAAAIISRCGCGSVVCT